MSWRKWVVRSVTAVVLASCLGAGVVYQQWTNPTAVRLQVVEMLQRQFPGATITLNGASMRLLGGVVLSELRLLRSGGGESLDFVHIPQATVHLNKERLLDGKFAVCRIEMLRPNVRIARAKDGTWNVEGLTGKTQSDSPLPTIVIQQGTLTVDDEFAGPAVWEIQDVNLTLIQESPDSLSFSGTGRSETFGALEVGGNWNRRSNAAAVSLRANGLSITKELLRYALALRPEERLRGLQLEGKADISADVNYLPTATPSLQHQVQCVLRQVSVDHPKLPVALHNLSASLRCDANKLILERLKAAAGSGKIECRGWADLADPENTFTGELIANHLPITRDLCERLPTQQVLVLYELFRPIGRANAHFWAEKKNGDWTRKYCTLEPESIAVCFEKFQYPLERVRGNIDYDYLQKFSKFDVVGYSGACPITVRGSWKGSKGEDADAIIEIAGNGIPLDEKLILALKSALQDQARSFRPSGKGDFRGLIRRVPNNLEYLSHYHMHFVDCTVLWKEFPYPLENVTGDLIVLPNERYEFKNFHGTHNGGQMFVNGHRESRLEGAGDSKLTVNITGRDLCLDADLRTALAKFDGLGKTWDAFSPAGRLSFQAQVEQVPHQPHDLDISVDVAGCAITPNFFPYALNDVAGQFRYHKQKVDLANFSARHNDSQISIGKGTVDVFHEGGFYAELDDLRGHLLADEDLLRALPQTLQKTMTSIHLKDQPFHVQTKLVVKRNSEPAKLPEIFWDGQLWVRGATLKTGIPLENVTGTLHCRGLFNGTQLAGLRGNVYVNEATVFKQPIQGARVHLDVQENAPDVMWMTMNSPLFGGDVTGQARIDLGSTLRYEVNLTASQIQLEQFGRHNLGPDHQLAGMAAGRVHLQGHVPPEGDSLSNLEGNGSIDVPYSPMTRILNLPLLLDLLKFIGLRVPDRTLFEEAHAGFAIHGERVSINKLEMLGNVISVYGKGEVNLDGTDVNLDMYPSWGRAEQVLPPSVRFIPSAISKQLLKIEMRGKIGGSEGDLQFHQIYVPSLIEPFQRTWSLNGWMPGIRR